MIKHYVISIVVSIIVVSGFVVTMFLIMLPQVENLSSEVIADYSRVDQKNFEFSETKHFVTEILSQVYTVNVNDLAKFQNNMQYKPGNFDPFTPKNAVDTSVNSSDQIASQEKNGNAADIGKPITGTSK